MSVFISPISDNRKNDPLLVDVDWGVPVPVDDVPVVVVLRVVLRPGRLMRIIRNKSEETGQLSN